MGQFIFDSWYPAGWATDFQHSLVERTLLERRLVFYRKADGTAVALDGVCPHRFAPLAMGQLKDDGIQCGYHGLEFDAAGQCRHNPHGSVANRARLRAYPLVERDDLVWIWMGEPGRADPTQIPDFSHLSAKGSKTISGQIIVKANYELLTDNLLDLSHVDYVHASFAGGVGLSMVEAGLERSGDALFVRYECPPAPAHTLRGADQLGLTGMQRQYMHVYWNAPSFIRLETGIRSTDEDGERHILNIGTHVLTPETALTTHYFYGGTRFHSLEDERLDNGLRTWHRVGFGEQDKPMIEAVQRVMGGTDLMAMQPMLMGNDNAAVQARRIVDQMRVREAEPAKA